MIGPILRAYVKPCQDNALKRHLLVFFMGILMAFFCFGMHTFYLISQSGVSYLLLAYAPSKHVHL
jgi:hypothetical protein